MRISHAPEGYDCPFCSIVAGKGSDRTRPEHVIRKYEQVTAFMNPRWWNNNPGNVLVVPVPDPWPLGAGRRVDGEDQTATGYLAEAVT